jgi:hypothetical protein
MQKLIVPEEWDAYESQTAENEISEEDQDYIPLCPYENSKEGNVLKYEPISINDEEMHDPFQGSDFLSYSGDEERFETITHNTDSEFSTFSYLPPFSQILGE